MNINNVIYIHFNIYIFVLLYIINIAMRIIRFELITLRLKGEYSTNWVTFPRIIPYHSLSGKG